MKQKESLKEKSQQVPRSNSPKYLNCSARVSRVLSWTALQPVSVSSSPWIKIMNQCISKYSDHLAPSLGHEPRSLASTRG